MDKKIKPRKTTERFKQEVFALVGYEYDIVSEYIGVDLEISITHKKCMKTFTTTPHRFKKEKRCPYCSDRKVYIGFNDLETIHPELIPFLNNKNDKFLHHASGTKVEWKCPDCGEIFKRSVADFVKRKFSCPRCGDGISYPNKFMYNVLLQVKDIKNIQREYRPKWCVFTTPDEKVSYGIYDIYFEKDERKYIVEMDGGLGHGNRNMRDNRDNSIYLDETKDSLAIQHGINVIRINSDYEHNDRFIFIRDNIIKSDLNKIIDFHTIDFVKADIESLNSYIAISSKLWNDGLSVKDISNKLKLSPSTISNYLKKCKKLGMCDYTKEESVNRSSANKVYCLNTKIVFDSIISASKEYNISASSISKCCRGVSGFAGYFNNEQMLWAYYDDLISNGEDFVKCKLFVNHNFTKVMCVNTGEAFNSIKDAAEKYKIRASCIQACCKGITKYSGIDVNTGNKLVWKYITS